MGLWWISKERMEAEVTAHLKYYTKLVFSCTTYYGPKTDI